ncbi:hypothetical protein SRB5_68810 [Streptomyces sp. RB5]|uniref:HTH arsR-type domain-containing protein n=1 Tax=Streptomyces smaragdinus TaxID=2585196 RepID=A0A7K0CT83_9ACTN|nr:helix-turn-helix domain-containing protein [Streptomyces smaragdinus]MQY16679.1 hypothetical protein [Streptomyces smaragdinus]
MTESGKQLHDLNPQSLRGLAHPLRMRLLNALREHGPATASQLADRLGESSGATSYHLRQLAAVGLIEDDPEHGKGRERWWRRAYQGLKIESAEEFLDSPDPQVRGAMDIYLHEIAAEHTLEVGAALAAMRDWPKEWRDRWTLSNFKVRLTPELAYELYHRMFDVIREYEDRVPEDTAGSREVRIHLHGFPQQND